MYGEDGSDERRTGGSFDQELPYVFSTLANGTYVTIKRSEKRSIRRTTSMWMWFQCIENETGPTPRDDIYMYYCKKFLMKTIGRRRMERIYRRQQATVVMTSSTRFRRMRPVSLASLRRRLFYRYMNE